MVLLGMVPVLMQTPPTTLRISTSATCLPLLTAETAARCPEGPEPMTSRSYFAIYGRGPNPSSPNVVLILQSSDDVRCEYTLTLNFRCCFTPLRTAACWRAMR